MAPCTGTLLALTRAAHALPARRRCDPLAAEGETTIAVKIIDMLGEEVLIVNQV